MGGGFKPFGFAAIGVPALEAVSYGKATLIGEATMQAAITSVTLQRLLRGDRLIYLVELAPWATSDRVGA